MGNGVVFLILSGVALLFCVFLLFTVISTNAKLKSLEKKYKRFMRGNDGISLAQSFEDEFEKLDKLEDSQRLLKAQIKALENEQKLNYSKYGIVKYDAFEDVGGRLSFALALLNEADSGIVLNAIHSKDNCFLYLKEIVNGESYIMLSNEEIKALQSARAAGKEELLFETAEIGNIIRPEENESENTPTVNTKEVKSKPAAKQGSVFTFKKNKNRRLHDIEMEKSIEELRDIERENVADELKDMEIMYGDYDDIDETVSNDTEYGAFSKELIDDVFGNENFGKEHFENINYEDDENNDY